MSRILVTGASGFIGKALVARFENKSLDVISMNSINGDIADSKTLMKYSDVDIGRVFHLAAKTFVPDSWDDPQGFYRTNVFGTANVLEFCKVRNIPLTFVSAYIYGQPDTLPITEDSSIRPNNPYALSKCLAEEICKFYGDVYRLPVVVIRPFNIYGIGQNEKFLIPSIIKQALSSQTIVVRDLEPKRDFIYVDDVIDALMITLNWIQGYHVYNVGSGHSLSVKEVIDVIQKTVGTRKEIVCHSVARSNEIHDVTADISKAERELRWRPRFSFEEGIKRVVLSQGGLP